MAKFSQILQLIPCWEAEQQKPFVDLMATPKVKTGMALLVSLTHYTVTDLQLGLSFFNPPKCRCHLCIAPYATPQRVGTRMGCLQDTANVQLQSSLTANKYCNGPTLHTKIDSPFHCPYNI